MPNGNLNHPKVDPMANNNVLLRFFENGCIFEFHSRIVRLSKENNAEYLYTGNGLRIPLDNLLSINGKSWE
jgi:hypothetical protein